MNAHVSALLSAAAYLSSAADDLRGAGFGAFAEEVAQLLDTLDAEILFSSDQQQ